MKKITFDILCEKIIKTFNENIIQAGDMTGTTSAQCLGEPLTQMTLNTFHTAGVGAMGLKNAGVPRIKELVSVSKKIKSPSMTIFISENHNDNSAICEKIASTLIYTTLKHIMNRIDIYYDPEPLKANGFMEQDNVYNVFYKSKITKKTCQGDINNMPWLCRVVLNREKLMEKEINLIDIKSKFCTNLERILSTDKVEERNKYLKNIVSFAILSNNDNDEQPLIHIRFNMLRCNMEYMNKFIEEFAEHFALKGIEGVVKSYINHQQIISFGNSNNEYQQKMHYVIYTEGSQLERIRYVNGIDINKSTSNNIIEIYYNFGIEAARNAIIKEFESVFETASAVLNYQHIELLVDMMTSSGMPIPTDRHSLNKLDIDPLARASFEKTTEQLLNAGIFNETDHMRSVSSRIIAGLAIQGGTGLCQLTMDNNMLMNSKQNAYYNENKVNKTYVDFEKNEFMSSVFNREFTNESLGFLPTF